MKKEMLLLAAALLTGTMVVHAQGKAKGSQRVGGIRAGFQAATMSVEGSMPDTAHSLKSFYVGFFRDTKIIPAPCWLWNRVFSERAQLLGQQ